MTSSYPKISVITVVFNAAATILQTAEAVFKQTYPNLEYIIIDGGSTDGTLEIIKKIEPKLAYWVSEKDNGIYDAMNKGITASNGDWIIFIGADDVFYNNEVLSKIFIETIDKPHSIDFIYGDVLLKSKKKIFGGSRTYDELISRNINHQSRFYRKNIFSKTGSFNLKYKILADYELNLRIFRDQLLIKKYVPEVVTLYNNRGISYRVIDGNFYEDQLINFISIEKISPKDYRLQTYFFFYGFAHFFLGKRIKGLKIIVYSLSFGNRKFYYFLVGIKYLLSFFGFGEKIKTSFAPTGNLPSINCNLFR